MAGRTGAIAAWPYEAITPENLIMKQLTLLRHAKSSWKDPTLDDFDRPLNQRGKANAPLMGQRLHTDGWCPQLILCSPAERARRTAQMVAVELDYPEETIRFEDRIYGASAATLLEILQTLKAGWDDVMLVGHNPGLLDLANLLAPCDLENIVTCGAVGLDVPIEQWGELAPGLGSMRFYDFPKKGGINSARQS